MPANEDIHSLLPHALPPSPQKAPFHLVHKDVCFLMRKAENEIDQHLGWAVVAEYW